MRRGDRPVSGSLNMVTTRRAEGFSPPTTKGTEPPASVPVLFVIPWGVYRNSQWRGRCLLRCGFLSVKTLFFLHLGMVWNIETPHANWTLFAVRPVIESGESLPVIWSLERRVYVQTTVLFLSETVIYVFYRRAFRVERFVVFLWACLWGEMWQACKRGCWASAPSFSAPPLLDSARIGSSLARQEVHRYVIKVLQYFLVENTVRKKKPYISKLDWKH